MDKRFAAHAPDVAGGTSQQGEHNERDKWMASRQLAPGDGGNLSVGNRAPNERKATMFQQHINEARAEQYQQDCRSEAARERSRYPARDGDTDESQSPAPAYRLIARPGRLRSFLALARW